VALLILLALIVALLIGLGFVIKWLFIVAVVAALVWLITFFARGQPEEPSRLSLTGSFA
jgi:hypothetical protein